MPGPGWSCSESWNLPDQPSCVDNCHTGPRKSFPRYEGALWVKDWLSGIEDDSKALLWASGARLHNSIFTNDVIPECPGRTCQTLLMPLS